MRCFKEEKIQEYFNDAVIVTTRKHFYYMSAEEKRMHKIKMASQGFEDSGQNVKMINIHTANLRPTKSLGVRETESMVVGD